MIDPPTSISCIFVDDEPMGLSVMQAHADKIPFLRVAGSFASATRALAFLGTESVDLIFLDIQMPDLSGLEMARILGSSANIIFTTAYPQYAVEGFDLAAVDYLLKPISFSRFMQACKRAGEKLAVASPRQLPADFLFVKTGFDWVRINLESLHFVEADDNYVTFFEEGRKTLCRMRLAEVLERLPAKAFIRIHKSYVIALGKIDRVERHQVTISDRTLPVSAGFREGLLSRLGAR